MPRPGINNYTFYKIANINGDIDLCYVGSTANFNQRVRAHRNGSKTLNTKLYTTIREHGGWCEFKMVPIGTAEQLSCTEAHIIEEEYRIKLKAELNSIKCFISDEERKKNDREYSKEHCKEYYEKNKEKIIEYKKEWYETNKEKIAEHSKEYRETNKVVLAEQKKEYYEANKEKINEKLKEKITCECGCIVRKNGLSRHKRTQTHINLINNINNIGNN